MGGGGEERWGEKGEGRGERREGRGGEGRGEEREGRLERERGGHPALGGECVLNVGG